MTITRGRLSGREDPLAHRPHLVWLTPGRGIYGYGVCVRFDPGIGPERYRRAREFVEAWWGSHPSEGEGPAPVAFASFTFDPEAWGSVVEIPAITVSEDRNGRWMATVDGAVLPPAPISSGATFDRPRFAGSSLPDHLWLEAVVDVLSRIEAGTVEKVVLARDHALWSKRPFDARIVLDRLSSGFPDCYTYLIDDLVGASPELLIRRQGNRVSSRVLAGSAPRGPDASQDIVFAQELLRSKKNLHEHALAASSVSSVLAELCHPFEQDPEPRVLKLANVQHLSTAFSGTLIEPHHVLDLVGALHPTAAVGGTPSEVALGLIRSLEGMNRGRYAGPVGYFDPSGEGEFALALRCAELSGARARLFAGAGVVSGSVPEQELEETRLKLRAMLSALE